ncbi:MAG TPA: hypothetical protein VGD77_13200 [Gemmatimonadaceae bacterium]
MSPAAPPPVRPKPRRPTPRRGNLRRSFHGATRAAWMGARARNALRRPAFIGAISAGAFVAALTALIVIPLQERKGDVPLDPAVLSRPAVDTIPASQSLSVAQLRVTAADSALQDARTAAQRLTASLAEAALTPEASQQRDSIAARMQVLDTMVARAENVPLPTSYRALASLPDVAAVPRVRALVDSLADVERERESMAGAGGADPAFISLTSRLNEIGAAIRAAAAERRSAMQREFAALAPPPPPQPDVVAAADTAAVLVEAAAARAALDSATTRMALVRKAAIDSAASRQRSAPARQQGVPPLALLGAALVIGAALGFGAAFGDELRHSRLADAQEAERVTGLRVLGTVRPRPRHPDLMRRQSDREMPPYIDPRNEGYQLAYLSAATSERSLLIVTVTGQEPEVCAVVASNFAAISAEEARSTLLVDTDSTACDVAAALQVHAEPGVVDIADGTADWAEATQQVTIGRSGNFDVVASGTAAPAPADEELRQLMAGDLTRLSRRYDTVVLTMAHQQALGGLASALPGDSVIYCVRVGATRIRDLLRAVSQLSDAGTPPLGLVVWDADVPELPPPEELAHRRGRPRRTSEYAVPRPATTG